jgi:hypothetical protein
LALDCLGDILRAVVEDRAGASVRSTDFAVSLKLQANGEVCRGRLRGPKRDATNFAMRKPWPSLLICAGNRGGMRRCS